MAGVRRTLPTPFDPGQTSPQASSSADAPRLRSGPRRPPGMTPPALATDPSFSLAPCGLMLCPNPMKDQSRCGMAAAACIHPFSRRPSWAAASSPC